MADLVAVRAPTSRLFLRAWDKIAASGDAVLPLDPKAPDEVVARLLRATRPAALITSYPGRVNQLRTIRLTNPEPIDEGTVAVVATSGSMSAPKAVVLSHEAMDASTEASLRRLGCSRRDRWMMCLPWHHVAGLAVIRRSRALGSEPHLLGRLDHGMLTHAIEEEHVRWTSLVPTQLRRLLDAGVPLNRLDGILLGGAAADAALLADAATAGVRVVTSYGMTETFGGCVYDGQPLDGTTADILPDGRIRLDGKILADGYRLDTIATADAFTSDGYVTNDLGEFDDDGLLRVLGRADDVVLSGGENVPTGQVAQALRDHPDVEDAFVVGLPDEVWGQLVAAVVVARGAEAPDLDALRDHVSRDLPRSWAPQRLVTVDELPRTSLGKPDRREMRALFEVS